MRMDNQIGDENEAPITPMDVGNVSIINVMMDNEPGKDTNVDSSVRPTNLDGSKSKTRGRKLKVNGETPKTAKTSKPDQKSKTPKFWTEGALTKENAFCSICLGILMEPVCLPCMHSMCLECYNRQMELTSLQCPLCRYRLSVWARNAVKQNTLVNTVFWERIKEQFPVDVNNRITGADVEPFFECQLQRDGIEANPGEIREEFDNFRQRFDVETESIRRREEEASTHLIQQIQEEEPPAPSPQSPTQLQLDFELAAKLQEVVNTPPQSLIQLKSDFELAAKLQETEERIEEERRSRLEDKNAVHLRSASNSTPSQTRSKETGRFSKSNKRPTPASKSSQAKKSKSLQNQPKISTYFSPSSSPSSSTTSASTSSNHRNYTCTSGHSSFASPSTSRGSRASSSSFSSGFGSRNSNSIISRSLNFVEEIEDAVSTTVTNLVKSVAEDIHISDTDDEDSRFPLNAHAAAQQKQLTTDSDSDSEINCVNPARTKANTANNSDNSDVSSHINLWDIYFEEERERLRKKELQEEEDRKFALSLQRRINRSNQIERPEYELRKTKRDST